MINRRRLIKLAAPALILPRTALAGRPKHGLFTNQVKPNGVPSGINSGSSLMTTAPLFYGVDTGTASNLVDVTGNCICTSQDLPGTVAGPYGTSQNWSTGAACGAGMYATPTTAIHMATALLALGMGAAYTFAVAFYPTGATSGGGWIGGRPAFAYENAPMFNWGVILNTSTLLAGVNNNLVEADIGTKAVTLNSFCTVVIVCENTSGSAATASFYFNGVLIASVTGLSIQDTGPSYSGGQQDIEEQIMFGAVLHTGTGETRNYADAQVFEQIFIAAAWTPTQIAFFHTNPYDGLTF